MNANADRWLEMYNGGMTIEDISLEERCSMGTVGMALRAHPDYVSRPPGSQRKPSNHAKKVYKDKSPSIKNTSVPGARGVKRGRGRGRGRGLGW